MFLSERLRVGDVITFNNNLVAITEIPGNPFHNVGSEDLPGKWLVEFVECVRYYEGGFFLSHIALFNFIVKQLGGSPTKHLITVDGYCSTSCVIVHQN